MIALTFDIDWAEDWLIEDTLAILDANGARATFFATHDTPVLLGLDRRRFEIGLHPNFLPLLNKREGSATEILDEVFTRYPEAKGFRSHGLVTSPSLLEHAAAIGMVYDSNQFLPEPTTPFLDYQGLWRTAFFWRDTRPAPRGKPYEFADLQLPEETPAIFCFHPVHVFLNTESSARYKEARSHLADRKVLSEYRNTTAELGARDFLVAILAARPGDSTHRMMDVIAAVSGQGAKLR